MDHRSEYSDGPWGLPQVQLLLIWCKWGSPIHCHPEQVTNQQGKVFLVLYNSVLRYNLGKIFFFFFGIIFFYINVFGISKQAEKINSIEYPMSDISKLLNWTHLIYSKSTTSTANVKPLTIIRYVRSFKSLSSASYRMGPTPPKIKYLVAL